MYYTYARNTQVSLYQHTLHNSVNYLSYSKIVGISQRRCCRTVQRDHQRRGITEPESSTQSAVITTSLLYEICNLRDNSCSPDSYVDYMYNVLIHFFLSAEAIVILPLSDLIPPLPLDYYFSPKKFTPYVAKLAKLVNGGLNHRRGLPIDPVNGTTSAFAASAPRKRSAESTFSLDEDSIVI